MQRPVRITQANHKSLSIWKEGGLYGKLRSNEGYQTINNGDDLQVLSPHRMVINFLGISRTRWFNSMTVFTSSRAFCLLCFSLEYQRGSRGLPKQKLVGTLILLLQVRLHSIWQLFTTSHCVQLVT